MERPDNEVLEQFFDSDGLPSHRKYSRCGHTSSDRLQSKPWSLGSVMAGTVFLRLGALLVLVSLAPCGGVLRQGEHCTSSTDACHAVSCRVILHPEIPRWRFRIEISTSHRRMPTHSVLFNIDFMPSAQRQSVLVPRCIARRRPQSTQQCS